MNVWRCWNTTFSTRSSLSLTHSLEEETHLAHFTCWTALKTRICEWTDFDGKARAYSRGEEPHFLFEILKTWLWRLRTCLQQQLFEVSLRELCVLSFQLDARDALAQVLKVLKFMRLLCLVWFLVLVVVVFPAKTGLNSIQFIHSLLSISLSTTCLLTLGRGWRSESEWIWFPSTSTTKELRLSQF